jgi:hypothetical protein
VLSNIITNDEYYNLGYDPINGSFWRIKKEESSITVIRKLIPNENNMLSCLILGAEGIYLSNRKASIAAWSISNGVTDGIVMLRHENDYRLSNLYLLTKSEYVMYRSAVYNSRNARITYYGEKYRVNYRVMNKSRYETFEDEETAKVFRREIIQSAREVLDALDK